MKKKIKIVTVVVSYNSYRSGFFPRCLNYLKKVEIENEDFSIDHSTLVVDSNSSDETVEKVKRDFSVIKVLSEKKNLGYAGGNNKGIDWAIKSGADFVAIVTHDICVQPNWLLEAVKVADLDKNIGVVQPLLLLWPDKELINSTGNCLHFLGYGYAGDYRLPFERYTNETACEIPYFSGAIILLRVKALKEVGNFDEEMWMYCEDLDLGWRMWLHCYRNVLAPKSIAYHQYEFSRSIQKMYYMDRNRILAVLQNYHWLTFLLIFPVFLINEVATLFFALKGGWGREKLAVWKYFLKLSSWKLLLRKRRLRQKSRIVSDRLIIQRFTGRIDFQEVLNPLVKYLANPILSVYWFIVRHLIYW